MFCDVCGSVRMVSVGDCRLCEVMARNVALEEEMKEVRSVLKEAREEVSRIRTENSVRSKTGVVESTEEPEGESWRVVCKGGKRGTRAPRGGDASPPKFEVACSNRFSLLATSQEQEVDRTQHRQEESKSEEGPEVLLIGDSQVRYLDRTFCENARERRVRMCLPGARVQDVSDKLDRLLVETGSETVVVVHVGGNDVARKRSEELVNRYRVMLEKVRSSGRTGVVCGVIPRICEGGEWLSRAISLNDRIEGMCRSLGLKFVDGWDTFFGKHEMFAKDGVHLSRLGAEVYGAQLEGTVMTIRQGN